MLLASVAPGDDSAEAGFARDMIVHHGQAVQMAEIVRGRTTSTTVVHNVTLEGLLSGEPMLVNVHEPGPGEPPPVTCANLNEAV